MEAAKSKEYSSLPLIIGIAGAIVVSATGGWFALGSKSNPVDSEASTASFPAGGSRTVTSRTRSDDAPIDIGADLRKARLSVDADLLVSPPEQNALFYYSRVLSADPDHPVANAELDAVLTSMLLVVDNHLAAGEFDQAYDFAIAAARHHPEHRLIDSMRSELNEFIATLVDEAAALATEGNDEEAMATIAALEGLPGITADYLTTAQQAVLNVQEERDTAEQEVVAAEEAQNQQAELEWAERVSAAIAAGNLIVPEGESARDLLAELDAPAELKGQLSADFQNAMLAVTQAQFDAGELDIAETYLLAAADFGTDEDMLAPIRADLERSLIEREGNNPIALSEFVRLESAPAKYPARASTRDITGWVEVSFVVTAAGQTADIQVTAAEPADTFDDSVIDAVEKWTFEPRLYRGQPINQRTSARLIFDLE